MPKEERPTYHEIRGMAARLIEAQGISPQERMGHSDSKSTKIYTSFGKGIEWVQVPHIKVQI
ncbi:integrase [Pseudoalteromonas sp. SCSIO 43088]|nr:integrase [Pseudoalteromonas sp. SCSIO 43088]